MVDVRFELTTNDPWSADAAICEGISPLGYSQKVNQSPTHTKALVRWATGKRLTYRLPKLILITLSPPSEQRDSWSSYGAVRAYSEVRL